jgi:hypothetical protein
VLSMLKVLFFFVEQCKYSYVEVVFQFICIHV